MAPVLPLLAPPPWEPPPPDYGARKTAATIARNSRVKERKKMHQANWIATWSAYVASIPHPSPAQSGPLEKKRINLHAGLRKAKSSLATQIRCEKIGFYGFPSQCESTGLSFPRLPLWMEPSNGRIRYSSLLLARGETRNASRGRHNRLQGSNRNQKTLKDNSKMADEAQSSRTVFGGGGTIVFRGNQ